MIADHSASDHRPTVLHLSGDFPDCVSEQKTQVVKHLIELTNDQFNHHVVSINRISPSTGALAQSLFRRGNLTVTSAPFIFGSAVSYTAPSRGLLHETFLLRLGRWLVRYIAQMDRRPDLIVGHKLAIEGIAVREAARISGIPYALSIQGDSDTKIMDVRRDLKRTLTEVFYGASFTFPFSKWGWDRVVQRLGDPPAPHAILPCPTELDQPVAPRITGAGLVSVFHLNSYRRKNFATLAQAMAILDSDGTDMIGLDVVGGGDAGPTRSCERIASKTDTIRLKGAKDRSQVQYALNRASAFVLPSRRETFGLVFVEALFAGTPIIYPAGTAVDGLFDHFPFALRVPAKDPRAIAEAIRSAVRNEATLKAQIASWHSSDHAKQFQRKAIAETFAAGLQRAMIRPIGVATGLVDRQVSK